MKTSLRFILLVLVICAFAGVTHAQENVDFPDLPGRIAYIGLDGNVYVLNSNAHDAVSLTEDAAPDRQYSWPTWSTDGRLAYFSTTASTGLETDIFISKNADVAGDLAYAAVDEAFTYAYWSPQNCADSENCRDLAVLLTSPLEQLFSVRLVRSTDQPGSALVGKGSPFYYSWSPDGARMLLLRDAQRLDIYDATHNKLSETLPQLPGNFHAPAWSPVDDRLLLGVFEADQQSTDLATVANDQTQVLASQLGGPVAFSWSPDGNYIAYSDNAGPLVVIDSHSGQMVSRSSVTGVFSFFWSPDSKHVAYITLASSPGSFNASAGGAIKVAALVQSAPGIAWSVMDVSSGETRRYGAFYPTNEMIYLFSFFDQFGQSHRLWSPDSRYLIYGELKDTNKAVVSILDTTQSGTVPFSIADGVFGVWSFQ